MEGEAMRFLNSVGASTGGSIQGVPVTTIDAHVARARTPVSFIKVCSAAP
jgi:hypothetical protein